MSTRVSKARRGKTPKFCPAHGKAEFPLRQVAGMPGWYCYLCDGGDDEVRRYHAQHPLLREQRVAQGGGPVGPCVGDPRAPERGGQSVSGVGPIPPEFDPVTMRAVFVSLSATQDEHLYAKFIYDPDDLVILFYDSSTGNRLCRHGFRRPSTNEMMACSGTWDRGGGTLHERAQDVFSFTVIHGGRENPSLPLSLWESTKTDWHLRMGVAGLYRDIAKRQNDTCEERAITAEPLGEKHNAPKGVQTTEVIMADTKSPARGALQAISDEAVTAAYHVGASQLEKLVREPLVAALSRHLGPGDEALRGRIAAFLGTEIGRAFLSAVLGLGLDALPVGMVATDKVAALAKTLRVRAMATAGDFAVDLLLAPVREVLCTQLAGLPEPTGVRVETVETAEEPAGDILPSPARRAAAKASA